MSGGLRFWAAQDAKRGGHKYTPRRSKGGAKMRTVCSCGSRAQITSTGTTMCSRSGRPVNECRSRK